MQVYISTPVCFYKPGLTVLVEKYYFDRNSYLDIVISNAPPPFVISNAPSPFVISNAAKRSEKSACDAKAFPIHH